MKLFPSLLIFIWGVFKIPTEELLHDDAIDNTEAIIVGTDRKEVLDRLQTVFAREFQR